MVTETWIADGEGLEEDLESIADKGASLPVIRLITTFLSSRTMSVQVGSTWSALKPVTGGSPQGSILGVFLFNTMTDDLEDNFLQLELNTDNDWSSLFDRCEPSLPERQPLSPGGLPAATLMPKRDGRVFPLVPDDEEGIIGGGEDYGVRYVFLPIALNVPCLLVAAEVPEERNHWTEAVWRQKRVRAYKYLDET